MAMQAKKSIISVGKHRFTGFAIPLAAATFVVICAPGGYVMCGYLNIKTSNRFNEAACIVTGVSTPQQMLKKTVVKVSRAARRLGITEGMPVKEALKRLV